MKLSSAFIGLTLASALLLPACAAPKHSSTPPTKNDLRAEAKKLGKQKERIQIVPDDPNCVESDLRGGAVRVRTCLVHTIQPSGYSNSETGPQVATLVQTPKFAYGNPMGWTVEVRKNGKILVHQALTTDQNEAIERDGSLEVESSIPLGDLSEIQPGEYEVIFTPDDENEEPIRTIITVPENPDSPENIDTD